VTFAGVRVWEALPVDAEPALAAVVALVTLGSTHVALPVTAVLEGTAGCIDETLGVEVPALAELTPGAKAAVLVFVAFGVAITLIAEAELATGAVPVDVTLDPELTEVVDADGLGRTVIVESAKTFERLAESVVAFVALGTIVVAVTLGIGQEVARARIADLSRRAVLVGDAAARILADIIDAARRRRAVGVFATVGDEDAAVGEAVPAVVAVRAGPAFDRLTVTELAALRRGTVVVIEAGRVQITDLADAEGALRAVPVVDTLDNLGALAADAEPATGAFGVVEAFSDRDALTREAVAALTGRAIRVGAALRNDEADAADAFGARITVAVLGALPILEDADAVVAEEAGWALVVEPAVGKFFVAFAVVAAEEAGRTVEVASAEGVLDALAGIADHAGWAVAVGAAAPVTNTPLIEADLAVGALEVSATLRDEATFVSDASLLTIAVVVTGTLRLIHTETEVADLAWRAVLVACAFRRRNLDAGAVDTGLARGTLIVVFATTGHEASIIDALVLLDRAVFIAATEEGRHAAVGQAAPVSGAVAVVATLDRLTQAVVTALVVAAVFIEGAERIGDADPPIAEGPRRALVIDPTLVDVEAHVADAPEVRRAVALLDTLDVVTALPDDRVTDLARWALVTAKAEAVVDAAVVVADFACAALVVSAAIAGEQALRLVTDLTGRTVPVFTAFRGGNTDTAVALPAVRAVAPIAAARIAAFAGVGVAEEVAPAVVGIEPASAETIARSGIAVGAGLALAVV
jgi:hypothetical protein